MKNIFIILTLTLSILSCKAQIAPLYKADPDLPEGTYYKDINNDLDKFEGTWLWQDGNNSFTLVLEKKVQVHDDTANIYEDMIIGEYVYIVNNEELINSLNRLNDNSITGFSHYISGVRLMHKNHPPYKCTNCTNEERRISISIHDPETPYIPMQIILRHVIDNGVEKLEAHVMGNGTYIPPAGSIEDPRITYGDYIFIKQ